MRQLQEYIRYTRGETITMLKTWKSCRPTGRRFRWARAMSSELFFLNITIALEVLSQENAGVQQ